MGELKHYDDAEIALIDARSKSNTHRIDEMAQKQEALNELATSVKVLATKQESVESDVKEIKDDVKTLTAVPGKRWNSLVEKAIAAIAGAVIAWLLAGGTV